MKTEIITNEIAHAADIIHRGGLVAVPTETVYGLAGNGLDPLVVERLYEIKGRPAVKPLSLMVAGPEAMDAYCKDVPRSARYLAEHLWPGPLTVVLKASDVVPEIVRAGGDTVGLRCPASEKTLTLLQTCKVPLAAPSANPSGEKSPLSAEEVSSYFDGKIEAIIDGGTCSLGTESTIVDLSAGTMRILRQGALPEKVICRTLIESLTIIGVTGGSGTGKTTALNTLASFGALIIDADAVYYELCKENTSMLEEINARFPGSVEDGILQRKKLGSIVFSDASALEDLRGITDRYVSEEIDRRLVNHAAEGGRYAAVDAINVLDTKLMDEVDFTVGILAPEEERVRRLVAREGITEEYARMRIHAQKPDSYFREKCDYIINNDSSMEEYSSRCEALFQKVLKED